MHMKYTTQKYTTVEHHDTPSKIGVSWIDSNKHVAWKCLASFEQMPALCLNHGTLWFVPKDMYENTCGSLVRNSPKLEATLISINSECINKW